MAKSQTDERGTRSTHYTRDAQGNTMAVYQHSAVPRRLNNNGDGTVLNPGGNNVGPILETLGFITQYTPTEHHIYGSSRLGTQNYRRPDESDIFSRNTGDKNYELANHLGNVLAVVSDRKITPNPQPKIAIGDLFEDPRNPGWLGMNGSDLVVNGNRQLSITFNDSTAVQGATRDVPVRGGSAVFFTLKVSKGAEATSLPPGLQFQVFDSKNLSAPLYSTPVPANGIVSASFEVTNDDMLTVALTATAQQPTSILLHHFYAYTLEQSLANNVTLTSAFGLKDAVRSKLNVRILGRFF